MDKYKLAEWLHDNYEQLAKAENWQTQETTRVKFEDLPTENKATMLALADKMLNTFLIISSNVPVMPSLPSFTDIRDEMDGDMEDSGMAQGEIESCLNHWSNKYVIMRKEWFSKDGNEA